ncbi:MAG: hypothetical protein E7448_03960 [Ruminococcaceae bacterium]|nr:hypothetical protein [Oscillospiraceae bacterium]
MKRIFAMILLVGVLLTLCACGSTDQQEPSEPQNPTEPTEEIVVPQVDLKINLEKEDTETHLRVFPANRTSSQQYAYVHVAVNGEKEREMIRFKLERQKGQNEQVEGDFEVLQDRLINMPGNGGYWIRFLITDADVYFYRITLYYGEHEILLASKTIYTPYQNAYYDDSNFADVPPEFHPMTGLNDEEQEFFDKCKYAVLDYCASSYYVGVNHLEAWQGEQSLYLQIELQVTDGTEEVWFAISHSNSESYIAGTSRDGIVPEGEATKDQIMRKNYFYVMQALSEAISE